LIEEASVVMMGIGHVGWKAPLHVDRFITDVELAQVMEAGAVGELLGQCIDESGRLIRSGHQSSVGTADRKCARNGRKHRPRDTRRLAE
jgi:DNA-binding transcriptional regulator LsrR (DeoR family)